MTSAFLRPVSKAAVNTAFNSFVGYGLCKIFQGESPRDIAIILAIDTAFRIATLHLLNARFGKGTAMVNLVFPASSALIQPLSSYLAHKLFLTNTRNHISLFGYIAASWKANMMLKGTLKASGYFKIAPV